jgi:hypothetical protein
MFWSQFAVALEDAELLCIIITDTAVGMVSLFKRCCKYNV